MLVRAYAKINLGLRVVRKRADEFHDIETVFHRINLFDEIELTPHTKGISLRSSNTQLPRDSSNLCVQAALLFQKETNTHKGVDILLQKNIPVGAGLGGGSSDAAAVLFALSELWNTPVPFTTLRELALQLGSDVPYFLLDGTAYATGRGEMLEYFPFEIPYWIATVFPNEQIFTKWAYHNVTPDDSRKKTLKEILRAGIHHCEYLREYLRNDFEQPVFAAYPNVRNVVNRFLDAGAQYVSLSGSGSSLFGFFENENEALEFQEEIEQQLHYSVFITEPNFSAM
ncbi:MAG: 4-(cytidine 5'-diphospho)-2-C-methyl-D-erythritol kinase [Bacteroidota bacterium]